MEEKKTAKKENTHREQNLKKWNTHTQKEKQFHNDKEHYGIAFGKSELKSKTSRNDVNMGGRGREV